MDRHTEAELLSHDFVGVKEEGHINQKIDYSEDVEIFRYRKAYDVNKNSSYKLGDTRKSSAVKVKGHYCQVVACCVNKISEYCKQQFLRCSLVL